MKWEGTLWMIHGEATIHICKYQNRILRRLWREYMSIKWRLAVRKHWKVKEQWRDQTKDA